MMEKVLDTMEKKILFFLACIGTVTSVSSFVLFLLQELHRMRLGLDKKLLMYLFFVGAAMLLVACYRLVTKWDNQSNS